ncbi:MAG: FAD/NAD(P)-binding protein [Candidatus Eremiobacteraeota bacterium]|nr:FAD/NAD(P)-binding protein [Candidatus Eremiobacteraeota bacterium]
MIRVDVAVIGGGFSGCAVAANLAKYGPADLSLALFEPDELGRGAAYGTRHPEHLLNTRARAMSLYADDPEHFTRWLNGRAAPDDFVSRRLYGDYVGEVARPLFARGGFVHVRKAAVRIRRDGSGFSLQVGGESTFYAKHVVVATGNPPPNEEFLPFELRLHPGYIGNPWHYDFRTVGGHVLILGSGLTALDVIGALRASRHRGRISVVSRKGQYPEVHAHVLPYDLIVALNAQDARSLLRSFRHHVEMAQRRGFDWRAIVDALRVESEALWRRLPIAEQRRFDRHLRSRWDRGRHRAPAAVNEAREVYSTSGRLRTYAGRLRSFRNGEATLSLNSGEQVRLHADWIVNCTGVGRSSMLAKNTVIRAMLDQGIVSLDAQCVGLQADAQLCAIGSDGARVFGLWLIGAIVRGCRFEATAVPELRAMAHDIAMGIAAALRGDVVAGQVLTEACH